MKLVFATVWSSTSGQNPDTYAGRRQDILVTKPKPGSVKTPGFFIEKRLKQALTTQATYSILST